MGYVYLRVAAFGAALAMLPCTCYAQVTFLSDAPNRLFPGPEPVCVPSGDGKAFTSGTNDCTSSGGQSQITGLQVGDFAKSITIDSVGAGNVGVLFVGTGTNQTTLDGSNGNINLAGTLNIALQGGLSVDAGNNNINFGGNVIHGVGTPTASTDAANKAYVDTAVANSHTVTNGFGDTASITSDVGNLFAGFKATSGTDSRVATLSAPGLTLNNGTTDTVVLDTATGNASFAGNLSVGGTSTFTGLATFNGGIKTTSIEVTGNSKVDGNQTVTGQSFLNGGATISNNLTVTPNTTVDMGGNRIENVGAPVTSTDAANKAYVNSAIGSANQRIDQANQRIDRADQGIAIAMAVQNPVLTNGDRFGVAVNFGDFAGYNAIGATAVGIIGHNVFGGGEKFGLTGGFGVSSNQAAGRVGVQLTW